MSRKHHTRHFRTPSRYKARLSARGLNRAPEMAALDALRRAAGRVNQALADEQAAGYWLHEGGLGTWR